MTCGASAALSSVQLKLPPIPANETQRLLRLRALDLLDSGAEERFDRITRLARRLFDVPIVLVSLVDKERQWFKSRQGLDATETSREVSFCGHAVADDAPLFVEDAHHDERFCDNPLVTGDPNIRFYAGSPIRAEQMPVGTLCLIDRRPRHFDDEQRALLDDLAAMVESELRATREATTDPLTGISNRRGFDMLAAKAFAISNRLGSPTTLLSFDLDGFKAINDTQGHEAGDRALVDFAHALIKTFRDADVIARFGGDEFSVLSCGTAEAMATPVERLRTYLAMLERPYTIRFSVGITERTPEHAQLSDLITAADHAMYERKKGR